MGKIINLLFLNRNNIKWLALASMIIDHIAIAFLQPSSVAYTIMRSYIGRISFPLFCVLFVEGFYHTKRPWRHIADLFIFGVISEPFFDKVLFGNWFDISHQNVMFTWCIGFAMLTCIEWVHTSKYTQNAILLCVSEFLIFVICGVISFMLRVDYNVIGLLAISVVYYLIRDGYVQHKVIRPWVLGTGASTVISCCTLNFAPLLAILPLLLYNNCKPIRVKNKVFNKYIFYIAYPLHLAVLTVVRTFI